MTPPSLKTPARAALEALGLYAPYQLTRVGFLVEAGWFRSMRSGRPEDRDGRPLPWLTYGAIAFLAARVRPEMRVFEWGAGASTEWWAARVARVVAVEHDERWAHAVRERLPAHAELHHLALEPGGAYARAVLDHAGVFDVVVIDGRDRVACAGHAPAALAPGGVIVWDDTDRVEYRPGIESLASRSFRRIEFAGMAPAKLAGGETSIFYRADNVLGI